MTKHIANILTGCRILGSIVLLFFPAFSVAFYLTYLFCGFTDMIDGTVAKKTNSAGETGAKIDTVADFVFAAASLIKLLPAMDIPPWLWLWVIMIAVIKIGNVLWGYVSRKQFIAQHTVVNKIAGLLLFLLPFTLSFVELKYSAIAVCSAATFAAICEGLSMQPRLENKRRTGSRYPHPKS